MKIFLFVNFGVLLLGENIFIICLSDKSILLSLHNVLSVWRNNYCLQSTLWQLGLFFGYGFIMHLSQSLFLQPICVFVSQVYLLDNILLNHVFLFVCIYSANLCLLIWVFNLFTYCITTDKGRFTSAVLLFVFCTSYDSFVFSSITTLFCVKQAFKFYSLSLSLFFFLTRFIELSSQWLSWGL